MNSYHLRVMLAAIIVLYAGAATAQGVIPEGPSLTSKSLTSESGSSTFVSAPWYQYQPKDDITAHEVAIIVNLLLPALACRHYFDDCGVVKSIDEAPPEVKRHFVRHEN